MLHKSLKNNDLRGVLSLIGVIKRWRVGSLLHQQHRTCEMFCCAAPFSPYVCFQGHHLAIYFGANVIPRGGCGQVTSVNGRDHGNP
jgi:hypothetical protein